MTQSLLAGRLAGEKDRASSACGAKLKPMSSSIRDQLARLVGTWQGSGSGQYATIEPFGYTEEFVVEERSGEPALFYVQRTTLENGEASHFEAGFLRVTETGQVEISNAQNSGRVEVLRGDLRPTQTGWSLRLESVALAHDERLVATTRELTLAGDELRYEAQMATRTTAVPSMAPHLVAQLSRRSSERR